MSELQRPDCLDTDPDTPFDLAIRRHDERVAAAGLCIWHGSEPTFTDRGSEAPEWLHAAAGDDKEARARDMMRDLYDAFGPGVILRSVGRQYSGEERPRWSYGLLARRDGTAVWNGPADPILGGGESSGPALLRFRDSFVAELAAEGWTAGGFASPEPPRLRVMARDDGRALPDPETDGRLFRRSPHDDKIPEDGLVDDLARDGTFLFAIGFDRPAENTEVPERGVVRLELPDLATVERFAAVLGLVATAAAEAELAGLIVAGFPPPVDGDLAWHTVTPDPAVVEVNMAPAAAVSECLAWLRQIYRAAEASGLAPFRFFYNGEATDSGGGGHITFGGPSPEASPFFRHPALLPNLIGYCNRHPALSYFFTPSCVGSSSQSPRTDENSPETFAELQLTLELLSRERELSPATLWTALSPFMRDASGNTHRSEINVEKLWNAYLPGRGCLGLVELRAFRMAPDPESLAARIALFRALLAMLAARPMATRLVDFGDDLHDRYALPFYLRRDLREVFQDLEEAGFGLGEAIEARLLDHDYRLLGELSLEGARLTVTRALEFWPLVGDSASQETGTSRLIDSSTYRIELVLRGTDGSAEALADWQLAVAGWRVPFKPDEDAGGPALVFGFRYRGFVPWRGLHPTLGIQTPVSLMLRHGLTGRTYRVTLHEWKPGGGPYSGLPDNWAESAARRQERLVPEEIPAAGFAPRDPPADALTEHCVDLRRLSGLR